MYRFLAIPAAAIIGLATTLLMLGLILQRTPDELLLDASVFALMSLLIAPIPGFLHPELRAISATVICLPMTAPIAFLVINGFQVGGFGAGTGDAIVWLSYFALYTIGVHAACLFGAWGRCTMAVRMGRRPAIIAGGYAVRTWNPSF